MGEEVGRARGLARRLEAGGRVRERLLVLVVHRAARDAAPLAAGHERLATGLRGGEGAARLRVELGRDLVVAAGRGDPRRLGEVAPVLEELLRELALGEPLEARRRSEGGARADEEVGATDGVLVPLLEG